MDIGVIGLGLMGGSLAKAVKAYTPHRVMGDDCQERVMELARLNRTVDGVLDQKTAAQCRLILLAVKPQGAVEWLEAWAPRLSRETVVVDCCGVKTRVCRVGEDLGAEHGFTFVGGHPMAGTEKAGFEASFAHMFQGASMILTPAPEISAQTLAFLEEFFKSVGFGHVQLSTPRDHDRIIACTSQLAHIVSSAYVKSPTAAAFAGFSAGSFADMTRVAWLDEAMWTDLFLENAPNLLCELDGLLERLGQYKSALAQGDGQELRELLKQGRQRKESLTH